MKPHVWRSAALSSLLLASAVAWSATRPHYGGILRIQLLASISSMEGDDGERMLSLTGDTLLSSDDRGNGRPRLATGWEHDPGYRKWKFRLRSGVVFHDGSPLTSADAAESLAASLRLAYPGVSVAAAGESVVVETPQAAPLLEAELASPRHAIVKRPAPNQLVGTGPFRVSRYEPGSRVEWTAFEEYWGGRPFIDGIEMTGPQQGRAPDLAELPVNIPLRQVPERMKLWTAAPVDLMAIVMPEAPASVREAIAQSLDRAPIVSVLTQRRGEAAYSLLPQWLSGYAFLFESRPDRERARRAATAGGGAAVGIGYAQGDALARLISERVVLNAREAGLNARLGGLGDSAIRVVRIPLQVNDARLALLDIARQLGLEQRAEGGGSAEALYNSERAMLSAGQVLPVVFVPDVYAVGARVRNWDAAQGARSRWWQLEQVWLAP